MYVAPSLTSLTWLYPIILIVSGTYHRYDIYLCLTLWLAGILNDDDAPESNVSSVSFLLYGDNPTSLHPTPITQLLFQGPRIPQYKRHSRSGRKTGSRSAKLIVCGYPEGVISLFFHVCQDIVHCPKAMNVEGKNWIRSWPAKYLDLEVTESGIQLSRFLEISTSWSHYPYRRTKGFFQ